MTPELAALAEPLHGRDVLLDGEPVCLDHDVRPDFHRLRRCLSARSTGPEMERAHGRPAALMVVDLLRLDGRDVVRFLTATARTFARGAAG